MSQTPFGEQREETQASREVEQDGECFKQDMQQK